jgi:hypothetical protein
MKQKVSSTKRFFFWTRRSDREAREASAATAQRLHEAKGFFYKAFLLLDTAQRA